MMKDRNRFVYAIDGGGTGCRVRIATSEGAPLANSSGGPANFATSPDIAIANITATVMQANAEAGITHSHESAAHAGLAGVMTTEDAEAVAAQLPFDTCGVSDDRLTSVIGALGTRDGVVLSVGTGSFVAARHGADTTYLGGWGFEVGDQASGAWLARVLMEQTLLAHDGLGESSDLTRATLARFDDSPAKMIAFAKAATPPEFGTLAPLIVDAAHRGDTVGRKLMMRGAQYLEACLEAGPLADDDVICLVGGIGPHYAPYLNDSYRNRVAAAEGNALDGALHLALALWADTGAQQ